ncbi:hypothetical protein JCM19236_5850 [Vibrio sp. JCM 19236]|nr:hypothetical protein JCM19236_5850 [Vibrio sp. JCM 19236]
MEGEKKRLAIDLCSPEIEQQGFDIVHQVLYEDADLDKNQASCNVHADGSHYSITVDGNSGKTTWVRYNVGY